MKRKAVIKNIDPQFLHKSVQKTVGEVREMASPTIFVSAAALVNLQNEVLISTRPEGKAHAGKWEFPGGKVEASEHPEQALSRELFEELRLDVSVKDMQPLTFATEVDAASGKYMVLYLYLIKTWQGRVQATEGQKVAWIPLSRLSEYISMMPPMDKPLAKTLIALQK